MVKIFFFIFLKYCMVIKYLKLYFEMIVDNFVWLREKIFLEIIIFVSLIKEGSFLKVFFFGMECNFLNWVLFGNIIFENVGKL